MFLYSDDQLISGATSAATSYLDHMEDLEEEKDDESVMFLINKKDIE